MREERLVIRPFEEIRIINYESVQEANEHARAKVTGWIPFKNRGGGNHFILWFD